MPFGAEVQPDGAVRFRLWAPDHETVLLVVGEQASPMQRLADGWHELVAADVVPGSRYRFRIADGLDVPDPASRRQPEDVHGPSEVVDPGAYRWQCQDWRGRPWHEAVIYELHVGTFTKAGTFQAAIEKLDHLAALGVTAIELMPVAEFPGRWNWGYDGVLPFAPDAVYGRPEDLKALIDAAHARGLMIFLDVVYNHFGPDGNYLSSYTCQFFTDRHTTPWGAAINFDGPGGGPVRAFFIHNALFWLEEYRFDGLRLDAVHAIIDDSERHILEEIAATVRERLSDGRHVHLILENAMNEAGRLAASGEGAGRYDAQWNDDIHHVLHAAATGEKDGYYADFFGDTEKLVRALAEGFAFQGEVMGDLGGPRGEPSRHLPPTRFISFIQNHDQIGNRAFGERLSDLVSETKLKALGSIYLLAPQIPMLFQGEEWATLSPFPFFCDFTGALGDAIRNGRREEFAKFSAFQDEEMRARIPDPIAVATFRSAKLDWNETERPGHRAWLDWYKRLLALRRQEIVPLLPRICEGGRSTLVGPWTLRVTWQAGDGAALTLDANLGDSRSETIPEGQGRVLWQEGDFTDGRIPPWGVRWSI
jgi:malto-oligosyltrehalose trehalohydrolase